MSDPFCCTHVLPCTPMHAPSSVPVQTVCTMTIYSTSLHTWDYYKVEPGFNTFMCDHKPPSTIFDSALEKVEPRLACMKLAYEVWKQNGRGRKNVEWESKFCLLYGMKQKSSRVFFTAWHGWCTIVSTNHHLYCTHVTYIPCTITHVWTHTHTQACCQVKGN